MQEKELEELVIDLMNKHRDIKNSSKSEIDAKNSFYAYYLKKTNHLSKSELDIMDSISKKIKRNNKLKKILN